MSEDQIDEALMAALAEAAGVAIAPACAAGTLRNLRLFHQHAARVREADDPMIDPAELLEP